MKHIAVFVDGSDNSIRALEMGKTIAEKFQAELSIVNVQEHIRNVGMPNMRLTGDYDKMLRESSQKVLDKAKKHIGKTTIKINVKAIISENTAETIINYLDKGDIDLAVLGSKGLSGITRFLMGSISTRVMQYTKVPVLIIK